MQVAVLVKEPAKPFPPHTLGCSWAGPALPRASVLPAAEWVGDFPAGFWETLNRKLAVREPWA